MIIKNYQKIALTTERKICLSLINTTLESIQPRKLIKEKFKIKKNIIRIDNYSYNLRNFNNIYLIGFGKGSLAISCELIKRIKKIKEAYIIDVSKYKKKLDKRIKFFKGDHPLPSINNFRFSKFLFNNFDQKTNNRDLFFIVICGGGSAMLTYPSKISIKRYLEINRALLKSGADIYEMNTIRKHLDLIKGGGLAKILFPAKIISLIFSDVPGNDLSIIASGPTVRDKTNINNAWLLIRKFRINNIKKEDLIETPKEKKYFRDVNNILILSNQIALTKIKNRAENLRLKAKIITDKLSGEVSKIARFLFEKIKHSKFDLLIAGGETTVKVKGKGQGGRNQELVLWFLKYLKKNNLEKKFSIISINSDGWDNTPFAGAIGDWLTLKKAKDFNLDIEKFLKNNDSYNFFKKTNDGIVTGRLSLNISDLILIFKNR
ncbi:MAG: DUF4147 domain-containing protein [Patescibacteria group bacterium]|nr:DUF4147 domain-containing protein [Patescibacteria group bacterium]